MIRAATCAKCGQSFDPADGSAFHPHPTGALDYVHGIRGDWWCNWCQVDRCEEYAQDVRLHAERRRAELTKTKPESGDG